jgi:hypothetical protein
LNFACFQICKYHIFVMPLRKKAKHGGKHNLWLLSTRLSAAPSRGRIEASVNRVDHAEVSQSRRTEELTPSQGVDQMAEPAMVGILQKQLLMQSFMTFCSNIWSGQNTAASLEFALVPATDLRMERIQEPPREVSRSQDLISQNRLNTACCRTTSNQARMLMFS